MRRALDLVLTRSATWQALKESAADKHLKSLSATLTSGKNSMAPGSPGTPGGRKSRGAVDSPKTIDKSHPLAAVARTARPPEPLVLCWPAGHVKVNIIVVST